MRAHCDPRDAPLRFEKLNLKQLKVDRKYLELVAMYQREVEDVRDRYNEDRSDPPVPKKMPSIAGRILWIQQLYKRIEIPMNMFRSHEKVITKEPMQKCIKIYNALVAVFIQYELIYHKAWYDSADIVRSECHILYIIVFLKRSENYIRLRSL